MHKYKFYNLYALFLLSLLGYGSMWYSVEGKW